MNLGLPNVPEIEKRMRNLVGCDIHLRSSLLLFY